MTENQTSLAAKQMLADAIDDMKTPRVNKTLVKKKAALAIAEKYLRMEEALHDLSNLLYKIETYLKDDRLAEALTTPVNGRKNWRTRRKELSRSQS